MQIPRAVCKKNGAGRERGQSGPAGDVCGKLERSRQGTGGRCVCARQKFSDGWWVRAEGSSAGNRKNNGWRTRCIGGAKEKQRKGTAAEPSAAPASAARRLCAGICDFMSTQPRPSGARYFSACAAPRRRLSPQLMYMKKSSLLLLPRGGGACRICAKS